MSENPDCKECYALLTEIKTSVVEISKNVSGMMQKMLYAILAFGGANIASKYFGTPIHVELAMYTTSAMVILVFLITWWKRRCLSAFEILVRLSYVAYGIWVTGLRIYHYNTETQFTQGEGVISQMLLFLMGVGFGLIAWNRDAMRKSNKRRWDD